MKVTTHAAPPSFSSLEELRELLQEGLDSGEGTVMTPEEWTRLREELAPERLEQRKAS